MTDAPALNFAGRYERRVAASLPRIWENVFDWEHLAHLHDGSFADCALLDRSEQGWRVALTPVGGATQEIELRADRVAGRYVSTTVAGTGTGTEIRVLLEPREPHVTDVTVEFHLPEDRPERLAALGAGYAAAYARLWDEDETMMQARERALAIRMVPARDTPPLDLGGEAAVRAALPRVFDWGGVPFRLVAIEGALVAHSTVCPHWLGPLDAAPVIDGQVRCPWHGYRFDVASGACAAHPDYRLAPAPAIGIENGRVIASGR